MNFKKNEMQSVKKETFQGNYSVNDLTYDFNNLLPTSLIDDLDSFAHEEDESLHEHHQVATNQELENKLRSGSIDNLSYNFHLKSNSGSRFAMSQSSLPQWKYSSDDLRKISNQGVYPQNEAFFNGINPPTTDLAKGITNNYTSFNRNENLNNISSFSNLSAMQSVQSVSTRASSFNSAPMSYSSYNWNTSGGVYSFPFYCDGAYMDRAVNFPRFYYSNNGPANFNLTESKKVDENSGISLASSCKKKDKTSKKKVNSKFSKLQQLCLEKEDFDDLDQLLASLKSDLSSFVRTQKGSRTLQKILDRIPPEKLFIILENLKDDFSFLMTDTYGNYLCQKLIQCCSAEQRVFILKHILKDFSFIACHPSGTHSLQSLIEIVNMKEEEDLIKECVKEDVIKLSLDNNGTHVMQKIVSCLNEKERSHINQTILENFYKLVFDSNGLCVLKKFINGNQSTEIKKQVIDKIQMNALEIVQNPFGNYIIQHIFDEWGVGSLKELLGIIINNVISLSMQKFSSNVVEKCLDIADSESRSRINKEIFNASKISSLIKNKYGNFVLQKALGSLSQEEKRAIKDDLLKKVNVTSNKEKARMSSLIENL